MGLSIHIDMSIFKLNDFWNVAQLPNRDQRGLLVKWIDKAHLTKLILKRQKRGLPVNCEQDRLDGMWMEGAAEISISQRLGSNPGQLLIKQDLDIEKIS